MGVNMRRFLCSVGPKLWLWRGLGAVRELDGSLYGQILKKCQIFPAPCLITFEGQNEVNKRLKLKPAFDHDFSNILREFDAYVGSSQTVIVSRFDAL